MKPLEQLEWTVRLLRYSAGQSDPDEALAVYRAISASDELRDRLFAIQRTTADFDEAWRLIDPRWSARPDSVRIGIQGAIDAARKVVIAFVRPASSSDTTGESRHASAPLLGPALSLSGAGVASPDSYAVIRDAESEIRKSTAKTDDLASGLDSMAPLIERAPELADEISWDLEWNGTTIGELKVHPADRLAVVRVMTPGPWIVLLHSTRGWESHVLETRQGIQGAIADFELSDGPFEVQLIAGE